MRNLLLGACAVTSLVGVSAIAHAQADSSLTVDEVMVTSQRRSQSLSDVPIAVTAFTAEAIEELNLTTSTDLQFAAPGLTITYNSAFPLLYIRGVGTDIQSPGVESSVAVYIDGVYQAQTANILKNLNNVERVEVLRGPQGTLYGRNATGGAINIVTKAPSDTWQGVVEAGLGDNGLFETSAFISGPISDKARLAVSGQYFNKDGYNLNAFNGEVLGDEDYFSFDAALDVDVTENLEVRLTGGYFKRDDSFASVLSAVDGNTVGEALGFQALGQNPREISVDAEASTFIETYKLGARVKLHTSLVDVSSITSYSDFDMRYRLDFDYSTATLVHARPNQYGETFTQEFQFTPGYDTENLDWMVGAFYLKDDSGFNPFIADAAVPGVGLAEVLTQATVASDAFAIFGEATYDFADNWSVTGGLRYSTEEKTLEDGAFGIIGLGIQPFPEVSESWDDFNYRLVLQYEAGDDMYYAKHETGFKSGTFNTANPAAPGPVNPEEVTSFEIGAKNSFMGGRVKVNTAAFYNDYENLQIQVINASGASTFDQAGKAEIYGVDLEVAAVLTDKFRVFGGANFLEAEYKEYISSGALLPNPAGGNAPVAGTDLAGKRLVRTPKMTFNIGGQYKVPTSFGSASANVNFYHSSKMFFDPANISSEDAFNVLNANVELSHEDSGASVMFWAKNILDEDYVYSKIVSVTGTGGAWADPISYGVRLKYKFD